MKKLLLSILLLSSATSFSQDTLKVVKDKQHKKEHKLEKKERKEDKKTHKEEKRELRQDKKDHKK